MNLYQKDDEMGELLEVITSLHEISNIKYLFAQKHYLMLAWSLISQMIGFYAEKNSQGILKIDKPALIKTK